MVYFRLYDCTIFASSPLLYILQRDIRINFQGRIVSVANCVKLCFFLTYSTGRTLIRHFATTYCGQSSDLDHCWFWLRVERLPELRKISGTFGEKKNVKLRFQCFLCNVVLTGGIHDRYNAGNDACWTQKLLIDTIKTFRPSYSLWIFWSFIKHKPTFRVAICNNDWYSFHFLVGESKLIFVRVHSYVPNRVRFMLTKTRVGFFSFLALDIWQGKVLITSAFVNYFMSRTPTEGFGLIRLFTYYFIFSWRAATWI